MRVQILTGATGSLGSHLLAQLSQLPADQVDQVICLVRGETNSAAEERVRKALSSRGLKALPQRYRVLTARLGRTNLGMTQDTYRDLVSQADIIIHVSPTIK
jgi:thioester reductase-like protein